MKIAVLDKKALGDDLSLAPLEAFGSVAVYDTTSPEEVAERIADADILLINKVRLDGAAFDAAKRLRLVCVFATGYDNISIPDAKRHGVAVANVPAYSTDSVALFTFATVLSLMTHLPEYRAYVADGRYTESGVPNLLTPAYRELAGKTWGIVGCGNIGGRVAAIAEACGARVIVHRRKKDPNYPCVDMDTLCRESDILTLHCPLTEETRHLIDDRRISFMRRDAILVNEARGGVVDSEAVARAIEEGRLGAFGSDVYEGEPLRREDALYRIRERKNVLLTPHAAWGAYEARERCLSVVCENITAFLDGKIKNRVDI